VDIHNTVPSSPNIGGTRPPCPIGIDAPEPDYYEVNLSAGGLAAAGVDSLWVHRPSSPGGVSALFMNVNQPVRLIIDEPRW